MGGVRFLLGSIPERVVGVSTFQLTFLPSKAFVMLGDRRPNILDVLTILQTARSDWRTSEDPPIGAKAAQLTDTLQVLLEEALSSWTSLHVFLTFFKRGSPCLSCFQGPKWTKPLT